MKVLLVCDRSGGHIFPALALAKSLQAGLLRGSARIVFFATSPALKEYVVKEGFEVCGKAFSQRNLFIELIYRPMEALRLIAKIRPDKVVGFGGRDSIFLMLLAWLLGKDTSIYEPNVRMGKANKFLVPFARTVLCGFAGTLSGDKARVVGVPLRPNIKKIERARALQELGLADAPVLFCFGGSQGSAFLNAQFMALIERLEEDFQVIHITGRKEYFSISKLYTTIERKAFVKDFYYNIELLYSAADAVICRAGASSIAEVVYYQLPSVLIPHPHAGGHQRDNARYLEQRSAAFVMTQEDFSADAFTKAVSELLFNKTTRHAIKESLGKLRIGVNYEDFCRSASCRRADDDPRDASDGAGT